MAKVKDRYLKPVLKLYDINKKWICNLTTNNPKNSIFNLKKNMKVNEIDTLSFQVAFDNTHISPNSCEMLIKHEFDWYIIKSVTLNSGDTRYLNVECESEFTISKTVLCETIEIIGETPEQMFNTIMNSVPDNKLNYVFKETDVTNRRSLIVESETSLFENLIKMAEAFECTIRFSYGSNGERYVSFIKEPHDRGRIIRRNNNLKNLNIVYDTSELFTKIMPFGADDDGIEINIGDVNPTKKLYVENYDYFIAKGMTEGQIKNNMQTQALKVIKYADIVDENDLYTLALRDLEKYSKPRVKGNVEYADLSVLEDSISIEPMIHEKIKIADSEIKMMLTSNISEIEIDYENILNSKITLDNVIEYNSIFKDLIAQGEKIDSVIGINPNTGKPSLIGSAIQGKIDIAITEIVGQVDVAEKMKPYAILFECNIEGHDLYGAMALGTKGLLIAKEKNTDNSWKWKTAINANGVYADELVGLTIMGEQIIAGTISSLDKSTWINLEDGTFSFAGGNLSWLADILNMSGNLKQINPKTNKTACEIKDNSFIVYDHSEDDSDSHEVGRLRAYRTQNKSDSKARNAIALNSRYDDLLIIGYLNEVGQLHEVMVFDSTGEYDGVSNVGINGAVRVYRLYFQNSTDTFAGDIIGDGNMLRFRTSLNEGGSFVFGQAGSLTDNVMEVNKDRLYHKGSIRCGESISCKNLVATGSKNRLVKTEDYGDRTLNAYETASCFFGDIGESQTDSNGEVIINIDSIFLQTVNTTEDYHVFISKYGKGDIWVEERNENMFKVKSTLPNIKFSYEIKAKQKNYETERLKEIQINEGY